MKLPETDKRPKPDLILLPEQEQLPSTGVTKPVESDKPLPNKAGTLGNREGIKLEEREAGKLDNQKDPEQEMESLVKDSLQALYARAIAIEDS